MRRHVTGTAVAGLLEVARRAGHEDGMAGGRLLSGTAVTNRILRGCCDSLKNLAWPIPVLDSAVEAYTEAYETAHPLGDGVFDY